MRKSIIYLSLAFVLLINAIPAQTTEFMYKGRLTDSGIPANGAYDLEFKIFDSASAGTLLATLDRFNTTVANGDYTISLDYGSGIFNGGARYLEVSYRLSGTGNPYTLLSPRDNLTVPYSINAANATTASNSTQLGGVTASQFVQTTDTRLADARNPLPGSFSYVQNSTAQQAGSNFNISGTGTASIFTAASQYNIGSNRVLSAGGTNNLFVGSDAGNSNTGDLNTFVGRIAGLVNTTGRANTFVGGVAGYQNTTGFQNTFVGAGVGSGNTTGNNNALFGGSAGGYVNASNNSIFGSFAGTNSTTGSNNSIYGMFSGGNNTTGSQNAFLGSYSGFSNTTGTLNTIIGTSADLGSNNLTNASAFGANTIVSQSNSLILGNNANVGIGISAPTSKLQVIDTSNTGLRVQTNASGGTVASFGGNGAFQIDANGIVGGRFSVTQAGSVGIGTASPTAKLHVSNGNLRVSGGSVLIANPGTVIITSPNGACWGITVNNSGGLSTFPVSPCP